MATDQKTIDFLFEQIAGSGDVRTRKMFGEYGVYCDDKIVALVCDDQLFLKPSNASKHFADKCEQAPPYPGAKLYYKVPEDVWDDAEWLSAVIRQTADALPLPKPRK